MSIALRRYHHSSLRDIIIAASTATSADDKAVPTASPSRDAPIYFLSLSLMG
jgi:hypothetical protein